MMAPRLWAEVLWEVGALCGATVPPGPRELVRVDALLIACERADTMIKMMITEPLSCGFS